jgi:hypothetical protein
MFLITISTVFIAFFTIIFHGLDHGQPIKYFGIPWLVTETIIQLEQNAEANEENMISFLVTLLPPKNIFVSSFKE